MNAAEVLPADTDTFTTRILLVRHAETTAPGLFHGAESDVDISESGREQARRVGVELSAERPVRVYSSALTRAVETARLIAQACGRPLELIPELHERKMGPLSGRPRVEHWQVYDETRARWAAGVLEHTHEGGESYAMIRDRVVPAFEQLAARHRGATVVVVAHGIVIRVALATLLPDLGPADFGRIPIENLRLHDLRHGPAGWALANASWVTVDAPRLAPGCPAW